MSMTPKLAALLLLSATPAFAGKCNYWKVKTKNYNTHEEKTYNPMGADKMTIPLDGLPNWKCELETRKHSKSVTALVSCERFGSADAYLNVITAAVCSKFLDQEGNMVVVERTPQQKVDAGYDITFSTD